MRFAIQLNWIPWLFLDLQIWLSAAADEMMCHKNGVRTVQRLFEYILNKACRQEWFLMISAVLHPKEQPHWDYAWVSF